MATLEEALIKEAQRRDTHKRFLKRLERIRPALRKLLARSRRIHSEASDIYYKGGFAGNFMRNLDDLVMHLEDACKEIREFRGDVRHQGE